MPGCSIKFPITNSIILMAQDRPINISEKQIPSGYFWLYLWSFYKQACSLCVHPLQQLSACMHKDVVKFKPLAAAVMKLQLTCITSSPSLSSLFCSSILPSSRSLCFYLRVDGLCYKHLIFSDRPLASHQRSHCDVAFWTIKQQPLAVVFAILFLIIAAVLITTITQPHIKGQKQIRWLRVVQLTAAKRSTQL